MIQCYICKNTDSKPRVYHVVHQQCVQSIIGHDRYIYNIAIPNGESICTDCLRQCQTSIPRTIRCSMCLSMYEPLYPGSDTQGIGCDVIFAIDDKIGTYDMGGYGSKHDDQGITLKVDMTNMDIKDRKNPILLCDSCIDILIKDELVSMQ